MTNYPYPPPPPGFAPYAPPAPAAPGAMPAAPPGYPPTPQVAPPWPQMPPSAPQAAPPPWPQMPPQAPQGYPPPHYAPGYPQAPPQSAPGYGRANMMTGFNQAPPSGRRGTYFNPGHSYFLELKQFEWIDGRNDNFVSSDWTVHETDDPRFPVGSVGTHMIKWGQDTSFGNLKSVLAALHGIEAADKDRIMQEITQPVALAAIEPSQPERGKFVELTTVGTKTRAGGDFTVHNWRPTTRRPGAQPPMQATAAWAPPVAAAPPAFPPLGWTEHPTKGWFYKGQEVVSEADLRTRAAQGRA